MAEVKWSKVIEKSAQATEEANREPGFGKEEAQQLRGATEANLVTHVVSGVEAGLSAREVREALKTGKANASTDEK